MSALVCLHSGNLSDKVLRFTMSTNLREVVRMYLESHSHWNLRELNSVCRRPTMLYLYSLKPKKVLFESDRNLHFLSHLIFECPFTSKICPPWSCFSMGKNSCTFSCSKLSDGRCREALPTNVIISWRQQIPTLVQVMRKIHCYYSQSFPHSLSWLQSTQVRSNTILRLYIRKCIKAWLHLAIT